MKLKNQLLLLISLAVFACSSDPEPADAIYHQNGVALLGYDVVAYHEMNQAMIGNPEYTSEYGGYTYRFLTTGHKDSFDSNPDQYLPAYGGWCAYAVAKGSIHMAPDPELWQIQDGKLQLFYDDWTSTFTSNLKEEWNQDPENYMVEADQNWVVMHPELVE